MHTHFSLSTHLIYLKVNTDDNKAISRLFAHQMWVVRQILLTVVPAPQHTWCTHTSTPSIMIHLTESQLPLYIQYKLEKAVREQDSKRQNTFSVTARLKHTKVFDFLHVLFRKGLVLLHPFLHRFLLWNRLDVEYTLENN